MKSRQVYSFRMGSGAGEAGGTGAEEPGAGEPGEEVAGAEGVETSIILSFN